MQVRLYLWGQEAVTGMDVAGTGWPRELYHFFLKPGSEYSNVGYSPLCHKNCIFKKNLTAGISGLLVNHT